MQKTKIEWTDYTWNPIKGLCPVDCKLPDGRSYCYARKIYKRFAPQWKGWNGTDEPFVLADEFIQLDKLKKPSRIFVCSTFELFHPSIKKHIHWVFNAIEKNPQHTFQILTKFPQNIDRPMPDNVWLGVSITDPHDAHRLYSLGQIPASLRFVSFEPILRDFNPFNYPDFGIKDEALKWIIIGKLTGHGNKYNPTKETIEKICCWSRSMKTKIFLKDNLKEIWGEKLIREMPNER